MTLIKRHYVDIGHGQMHLRCAHSEAPTKPTLFCFHMSPNSGRVFETLMDRFAIDRKIIAPDTPGFGMSDPPKSAPEIQDYAQAMLSLMDHLGIHEPVDVMGYHTGSMIAAELARSAPDRIRRIIMISAPIFTAEERTQFKEHYKHRTANRDGTHLVEFWKETLYWYEQGNGGLADVARYFPDSLLGGETDWWGHNAAFNYDLDQAILNIQQPLLVINPDDDLYEYSLRAVPLIRHGRMHHATEWGHCFLDHKTADAIKLLRSHLDL